MMEHEEIKASILEAAKGKRKRRPIRRALSNLVYEAQNIHYQISYGKWHPPHHERQDHQERANKKRRTIEKPQWDSEQIVHHMLMRQFRPIVERSAYRYACGCIKGRGPLFVAQTLARWVRAYNGRKFYVAELDVRKFYDSVDLDRLKAMLSKTIRDKQYLAVLFKVIDGTGPGLPKGYYTSPWLANFYIRGLDYFIVQNLRPDHYIRFVDNLYILHTNKRELRHMVEGIQDYLQRELGLGLNGSRQIYRFEYTPRDFQRLRSTRRWQGVRRKTRRRQDRGRAINSIGYVVHQDRLTMRKSILKRARAKANRMHRLHRCRRRDAAAMLSYKGWFDRTDTYDYFQRWIKPKVSIRYCRRRISTLAKRERERENNDKLAPCT
nr:RNA-directed DNA polymerase [uncultured Dysosmobacter sp.]